VSEAVTIADASPDAEERRGWAEDLRLLALLHDREPTAELLEMLRVTPREDLFVLPLVDERGTRALDFLASVLEPDVTSVTPGGLDELAADHAAIYLTHTHRVHPSESPWIDPEGLTSQQPMFAVRDWYRHWGLEVPNWRIRPDDHLVVQLGFVAHLLDAVDHPASLVDAARFLDRHLLRWVGAFADGVTARCWMAYWAAVAEVTVVHLRTLRDRLARLPGCELTEMEPIEAEKKRLEADMMREQDSCATPAHVPGLEPSW
jgi:TorA maturation chaperone TorD